MAATKKIIIDTDPGQDDAQAIMMALSEPTVDVLALTTVSGNVHVDKTTINALKVLHVCGRLDIPVYKGASSSILGHVASASHYHGNDGFGDVDDEPITVDLNLVKREHAVNALVDLVNTNKGEITLVCLGPLTNIALAIRMDPKFGSKLKDCYIMGGNTEGQGNITTSAEFNFHCDPEAAHIVLNELGCPMTIAAWELCLRHALPMEWYTKFIEPESQKSHFIRRIENNVINMIKEQKRDYIICDQIPVGIVINPAIVIDSIFMYATVELNGKLTRGQIVIDHASRTGEKQNECYYKLRNVDNEKASLLRRTEKYILDMMVIKKWPKYIPCDEIAMAAAITAKVQKKSETHYATVELAGSHTRGQVVLDRNGDLGKSTNVTFITELDTDLYMKLLYKATHG